MNKLLNARIANTFLAAICVVSYSLAYGDPTLDRIRKEKTMTAANNFEYPPFSFIDNGQMSGLDVDLANEIARRMEVKVEFQKIEFKGLIPALKSKRVDTIISALTYSPERAQQIGFSEPYFDGGIGAAYLRSNPVAKPQDLSGKRIGIQSGSVGERWLRDTYPALTSSMKTYDTVFLAIKDLQAGRLDVVVHPLPPLRYAARDGGIQFTSVWASRDVGINTRLEDVDLRAEIDKQLRAMKADGTYQKIVKKWFGE